MLGRPVGGGAPLTPLVGYNQFWFAWSVFHDGSAIFNRSELVHTAPLAVGDTCEVPCDQIYLGCPGTDCIPALTRPEAVAPESAGAAYLADRSFVVGVIENGVARAYPHNILWWHEIVNDVVGDVPIAVTHCPLTFSSIAHDPTRFVDGQTVELGVSGRLFNSNLVFYDRSDGTWFSQLLGVGTSGAALGADAPRVPSFEMTWAAWRALSPDTTVLSDNTGYARDYQSYPYGSYFTDNSDTFAPTVPAPDPLYPNKAPTYGVTVDGTSKAYVHDELRRWAAATYGASAPPVGVVNDDLGGHPIAIVFDLDAEYVQAFDRVGVGELTLTAGAQ